MIARSNVFALKRGQGCAHNRAGRAFRYGAVDDYGALEPLAFDRRSAAAGDHRRLRRTGENALALADFESGDFLPGRGLLDMKAGLAAGLAAMEAYAGRCHSCSSPCPMRRTVGRYAGRGTAACRRSQRELISISARHQSRCDFGSGGWISGPRGGAGLHRQAAADGVRGGQGGPCLLSRRMAPMPPISRPSW